MLVLGIHEGHDSGAAILRDGKILADISEERFTRVKHNTNTPLQSIAFCLEKAGVTDIREVDKICIASSEMPQGLKTLFGIEGKENFKQKATRVISEKLFNMTFTGERVKQPIYFPDFNLYNKNKINCFDHHLAHAACAYYTQPKTEKHLIFTIDGAGDQTCTAIWLAKNNAIILLKKYYKEAAIGWAYSIVTEGLGWIHGDGEGKVMGLAPYGDFNICKGVLDKLFPAFEKTELVKSSEINEGYFWPDRGAKHFHFKEAVEVAELAKKYGRENIAAEAQRKLEEVILNLVKNYIEKTGIRKICFAGGVFLNVKLNQKIWNNRKELNLEKQYIYPNPGDAGLAVGAALWGYYQEAKFNGVVLENVFLGSEYSTEEIQTILDIRKLKYTKINNPSKKAAELLAENKIVGWFQGRMESGPRALGNRSILMSPLKKENKDILNSYVKFRESFRPFCPSMTHESKDKYLKDSRDEFFMLTSFDAKEEMWDKIPAVVHLDGTVRPQMVRKKDNEKFWNLICEFEKRTGESVLLNTSFNVMGEPMVRSPEDAIRCFFNSGMDALFLGDFYLNKNDF